MGAPLRGGRSGCPHASGGQQHPRADQWVRVQRPRWVRTAGEEAITAVAGTSTGREGRSRRILPPAGGPCLAAPDAGRSGASRSRQDSSVISFPLFCSCSLTHSFPFRLSRWFAVPYPQATAASPAAARAPAGRGVGRAPGSNCEGRWLRRRRRRASRSEPGRMAPTSEAAAAAPGSSSRCRRHARRVPRTARRQARA